MADYKRAEREAIRVLTELGYLNPPINPVDVATACGVDVYFGDFGYYKKTVSGYYDAQENSIWVNKDEMPARQTFTIAHELGHKILHEEWAKGEDYKVLLRSQLEFPSDSKEQEANAFAAHLLVPKFMLDKYKDIAAVSELSKLFMVSRPVIQNRLKREYGSF